MSKKIVFMGTPEFSTQTLKTLSESKYQIEYVYTQPPQKSARGQRLHKSPVHILSEKLQLKVRNPITLNEDSEYDFFNKIKPYLVIVVAYGKIIPKRYLHLPEKGFINIHASLLPKWRGAAPIQRAIMNKDDETGISIMQIEEGLDTGPFMKQIKIKIDQQTTTDLLSKKLSKLGSDNILKCIKQIDEKKAKFIKQDKTKATYAYKINKDESKINWNDSSSSILSKINALNPAPGAWFMYKEVRYKIWKAVISSLKGSPGEIIDSLATIACNQKSIKILEIQREGKNKLSINDFLVGNKFLKGDKITL